MFRFAVWTVLGKVGLWSGLCGCAATVLAQTPGTFAPTGDMITARFRHTATLLQDGKVLIAGGGSTVVELYDPSTGSFTAPGARTAHENVGSATLLPDGRVLLIEAGMGPNDFANNAELYDPATGSITATGPLQEYQSGYTATLLPNGKVLITGGSGVSGCCGAAGEPELYDPSTQLFSEAGPYAGLGAPLSTPGGTDVGLLYSAAAVLPNGKVLVSSEPTTELYDPTSGKFSPGASMTIPWCCDELFIGGRAATLLANGNVLLTGGDPSNFDSDTFPLAEAELYDPLAGTFRSTGSMALPRWQHTATLLPDGTVLILGGIWPSGGIHLAELYNPGAGAFSATGAMISGRALQQATLLADGQVLVTGGQLLAPDFSSDNILASAELYTPAVLVPAPRLFALSGDGKGQGAIWHSQTGLAASVDNPAIAGEILSMYTTSLMDGGVIPPQISIGGTPAEVLYFGASGLPGYHQANIRVPNGVTGDSVPVRLMYIGRSSNAVTIAVR